MKRHSSKHRFEIERLWAPIGAVAIPLLVGISLVVITWKTYVNENVIEIEIAHLENQLAELDDVVEIGGLAEPSDEDVIDVEISKAVALEFPEIKIDLNPISPESAMPITESALVMPAPEVMKRLTVISEIKTDTGMLRALRGRSGAMTRFGGNSAAEIAVLRGLRWLKSRQQEDGRWIAKGEGDATAFALLVLLSHGEGFFSAEFGESVRRAAEYLVRHHKNNMAVYALSEAAAIVRTPVLSDIAERAVSELCARQKERIRANAGNVVARYCAVMAMQSARLARLRVEGLDRVWGAFADGYAEMRDARSEDWGRISGLGAWHYMIAGVCLQYLGRGKEANSEAMIRRLEEIWEEPTLGRTAIACCPVRSNYFATTMFFNAGGERWRRWNEGMLAAYVKGQKVEGDLGWWVCEDEHIGEQPFWPTCYVLMQLMAYYRYLPTSG